MSFMRLALIALLARIPFLHGAPPSPAIRSPAVVPGADLYIQLDYQGARATELWKILKPAQPSPGSDAIPKDNTLPEEEIRSIRCSVDFDGLDLSNLTSVGDFLDGLPAVLCLELEKSLTHRDLARLVRAEFARRIAGKTTFAEGKDGVLVATTRDPETGENLRTAAGLTAAGREIVIGPNEETVRQAIRRADTGTTAELSPPLAALAEDPAQAQLALILPKAALTALTNLVDEVTQGEGAAVLAGMVAPLKGLRALALRARFAGPELRLRLQADFSTDALATQAAQLINIMVAPILAQALSQDPANPPRLTAKAEGARVVLETNLTAAQLRRKHATRPDATR